MEKTVITKFTILLPAGKAALNGPISSKFAVYKINSSSFLKEYNERTKDKGECTIPAEITIYDDKSFSFILKAPPTSELLLKFSNIPKGGKLGKKETVSEINYLNLKEIAKIKLGDLNTTNLEKAIKCICGTALNMGIKIVSI